MTTAIADANVSNSSMPKCPSASVLRDQTRLYSPGVTLPESSISAEFFQTMLGKFKIDSAIEEDGDLRIGEAFGPVICVRFEPKRHWIILHTGFETPSLNDQERTGLANYLSSNLAMAQFAATASGIGIAYFMYYRGGLSVDQFMAMAQRFGSLAWAAMTNYANFETPSDQDVEKIKGSITLN